MKLYERKKYYDIESQYGDHNTGVKGFNDPLPEIFAANIEKDYPPLSKWEQLRCLMKADIAHNVHYSHDKNYEHSVTERYLKYMDELDASEKEKGFLYTGVPDFDKEQWKKMLNNLEGLS